MEKRASEDKVSLNSDSYKRCKKCGAVENEFFYDREQPDFMYSNNNLDGDYDWGMDYTGYEDMGMDGDYLTREDMDQTEMYPEHMAMGHMNMTYMDMNQFDMNQMYLPHMSMPQMSVPHMEMNPMGMENMYYDMPEMNDPYMGMENPDGNQLVPGMEHQHVDHMFQIIGHMLEEIINREARIIKLIEELKENRK